MKIEEKGDEAEIHTLEHEKLEEIGHLYSKGASMPKEETSEGFKSRNRIVRERSSLVALLAEHSDSNVSLSYHVNIIGTISYCQGDSPINMRLDQFHNLSLLLWTTSIHHNRLCFSQQLNNSLCLKRVLYNLS